MTNDKMEYAAGQAGPLTQDANRNTASLRDPWMTLDGGLQYTGEGDAGPLPLEAGWYRLHVPRRDPEDRLVAPALCADYGWGFIKSSSEPLGALVQPEAVSGVVRLCHVARGLRLELGISPSAVDVAGIRLERIDKWAAARRMLGDLARRGRSVRHALLLGLAALRGGLRGFGERLYADYLFQPEAEVGGYQRWVDNHASLSAADLRTLRERAAGLARRPRISIIVPVYDTRAAWLRRCLDSVLAQTYPEWELCVADDASPQPHVREILDEYAARDARIKVAYRRENGHISEASNSALALATGEWLALLDHDDELAPFALDMVVRTLEANPEARLVYSDEDKLDAEGRRYDPYFKPDWNPDLFYGHNMFSHLGVYAADLVRAVGGFRRGFEGSQDYDLALRCIERVAAAQIVHIPHVLYHWRAIPGSTALAKGEKNYAVDAGARALQEHLERIGRGGTRVEVIDAGYRLHWPLPDPPPKVTLIVPTRDRLELLRKCVDSVLERTAYPDYEILIVDNQSAERATRDYFRSLEGHPRVRVIPYDAPFNFSAINNFAVEASSGEIVGLVNNDIEVTDGDWLREMASQAWRPEIGCVGAMLFYPDDTIQHAGVILGAGGVANHAYLGMPRDYIGQMGRARLVQDLSAVTAACLLVRRSVYEEVGGLDEGLKVAFNDVDFCLRVRERGYRNLWTPFAALYHHESASRGSEDTPEKRARFVGEVHLMMSRWGTALDNDPAYNPNLTLSGQTFELAALPRRPLRKALGLTES